MYINLIKMKNKISIWVYFLGSLSCFFNAYFAYSDGHGDVGFVWLIAAGLSAGALGAHLEIKELKEKEDK
jgi:hypothetical protein